MRVFVTKQFNRFARSERMSDGKLCEAIERAQDGLIDADLGGGLIKQRAGALGRFPDGDCLSAAWAGGVFVRVREERTRQHRCR